jgi:hypothetical protein
VYESKFLSCAGGMYAAGPSTLMLQCVHFDNNNIDIDKNDGKLNISYNTAYNIYRSDGTTSVHGGDNVFDNASNISIHLLNTDNVYLDGYNQFTFSTNPYRVMNGNLSTTLPGTQNLGNNYWQMKDGGGSTYYNLYTPLWDVQDASNNAVAFSTSTIWSSPTTCTSAWDGLLVVSGVVVMPVSSGSKGTLRNEDDFRVYPNPANQQVYVYLPEKDKQTAYTIKIVDITGKVVEVSSAGNTLSDEAIFHTDFLRSGLYLLVIEQNNVVVHTSKIHIVH